MKDRVKGGLRVAFAPLLNYFGPRFQSINARLDQIQHDLTSLNRRLDDFERHITTDVQTAVEVLLTHQRSAAILQERLAELKNLIQPEARDNGQSTSPDSASRSQSHR